MSNNDFDNIMDEHLNDSNKRKRDENNNMNPLEYLQRRLTKNILKKLKSEIKQNKNLNLRLYIKNFRMLLTKEEKEINKKDGINEINLEEYKRAINIKKKLEEDMYNLNLKEIIQFDRIKSPKKYKSIKDRKKRKKFKEAFKKISYKYLYRKYKTKYLKLKNSLIIN